MGCDIHVYVEVREGLSWSMTMDEHATYHTRSYSTFSWLANVRNNRPGDDGYIQPISEPRGLPKDISPEVARAMDEGGGDLHSHSYFTAAELFAVPSIPERVAHFMLWLTSIVGERDEKGKDAFRTPFRTMLHYYNLDHIRLVFAFDN